MGQLVTFYSYKGGVGRTQALANIAVLLARWGYKVLCIDWDLEAPGLHLYFKPGMELGTTPGLLELIQDYAAGKQPKWRDHITPVNLPGTGQRLLLMSAGRLGGSYVQRLQELNWTELYQQNSLGRFLEELRSEWTNSFDFVFVDSRTGITDIGGICTIQLPDCLVLLFTANEQSLHGAVDVAQRAIAARHKLPLDRARIRVLPVATRSEFRTERSIALDWQKTFQQELAPLLEEWVHEEVDLFELLSHLRIPYIPFWSFGEKLPVLEENDRTKEDISYALETIAALLAQGLDGTDVLVRNRDSYVAVASQGPVRPQAGLALGTEGPEQGFPITRSGLNVFIGYAHRDEPFRKELEVHLRVLMRMGIIQTSHTADVSAGEDWAQEIRLQLETADLILFLVSADLMASDYLWGEALARALERHQRGEAIVVPIIIRPCYWQSSPLGSIMALPRDGKPVADHRRQGRDKSWMSISSDIQQIAQNKRQTLPRSSE